MSDQSPALSSPALCEPSTPTLADRKANVLAQLGEISVNLDSLVERKRALLIALQTLQELEK